MQRLILFLFLPFALIAQEKKHKIIWNSSILFESNGLNKSFLNSMLYGEHITEEMKSKWIKLGNEENIINSEIRNGLSYTNHSNKKIIGFSFADVNILNTSFTDDFLRLTLKGNFHYQDKILDFSGTSIRADRFQQYKITYERVIKNININAGISYLVGNYHLSYIMEKGSLYTAPFGTYLDIEYNINAFVTDTSNFSEFRKNGNGIAIDFGTSFNVEKLGIQLSLTDLGFIMWNPNSITLATDSTFNFKGVEVEDIFNFNDSVLEANNTTDGVLRTNTNSFKSYIPATLRLTILGKTEYKYLKTYTAGIIAKWQPYMDNKPLSFAKINQGLKESNFSPLYYIHSNYNAKYYDIIASLSYGGYSNNTNIGLALSKGKMNKILVGTHHIEDVFNGDEAEAMSFYFNIQIQF